MNENVDNKGIGWRGYFESTPIGNLFSAERNSGDIYIKTRGYDS